MFLDLANAFGLTHEMLWTAFNSFQVPKCITQHDKSYLLDLQLCNSVKEYTTTCQHLEIGIMAGCTISPLAFTMAIDLIIKHWVIGGGVLKSGVRLPPTREYIDDNLEDTICPPNNLKI